MNASKSTNSIWMAAGMAALILLLCVPVAPAQQRDPRVNPPVEPIQPITPGESSSKSATDPVPVQDGSLQGIQPLSGSEPWGLRPSRPRRSLLLPSFSVSQGADTNPLGIGRNGSLNSATTVGGQLYFQNYWSGYELTGDYAGGAAFYNPNSEARRHFHNFGVVQRFEGRRWAFVLSDRVNYAPESGRLSFHRLGAGPSSAVNVNELLAPDQSAVTVNIPRLSNTLSGELQLLPSYRSMFTVGGSYGILRFLEGNLIDHDTYGFRTGYNYQLNRRDTLALSYGLNLLRFGGSPQETNVHNVQAMYGRMLTDRIAFRVGGGPQIMTMSSPLLLESLRRTSWGMETSLQYRFVRTQLIAGYVRAVTGGSGLLAGAQTNRAHLTLSRELSRIWRGSVGGFYARNKSVFPDGVGQGGRNYNSWGGTASLDRPLGRQARMYLVYGVQRQTSNIGSCVGAACGLQGTRHQVTLGLNFRLRPIDLE